MIRVSDLEVRYNGRAAITVDHLTVEPGEWLAVVGPNGAGKSSLLNAIAGIVSYSGDVRIHDRAPGDRRAWAQLVSWVPQRPVVPPGMSVLDYVLVGRYAHVPYWGTESASDVVIAQQQLAAVDLDGFQERTVDRLSGGEQQRVAIARALAQESPVLLLDEPTASLDLGHQVAVLELVDELRRTRRLAVVAAMHDLTLAGRVADRLILIVDGTVVRAGSSDEILEAELLTKAYGTQVRVLRDDAGRPVVVAD